MRMEGGGLVARRVEIDTSAPFRSVKEAVVLFGERVLAGEVYANRLSETRAATSSRNEQERLNLSSVIAELEETRQHLEKANEERWKITDRLASLREELEETKAELQRLKSWDRQEGRRVKDIEIEDIKFVEEPVQAAAAAASASASEFQKKRYVTFANPPSLTRVLDAEERVLERHLSVDMGTHPQKKKKKKKPLGPLIAALFTKKKDNQDGGFEQFLGATQRFAG